MPKFLILVSSDVRISRFALFYLMLLIKKISFSTFGQTKQYI